MARAQIVARPAAPPRKSKRQQIQSVNNSKRQQIQAAGRTPARGARPLERLPHHKMISTKSMRAGLARRGMRGGCARIEGVRMDCCCRATSKYVSMLLLDELWIISSASGILAHMDGAPSSRVRSGQGGLALSSSVVCTEFVGEVEFLGKTLIQSRSPHGHTTDQGRQRPRRCRCRCRWR
jgi:hypothetical protein